MHDRHNHLESRVARVEASIESLASGLGEIRDLVLDVQRNQRKEVAELGGLIEQKTQPRPQLLVGVIGLILTVVGGGWLLVSTQIDTLKGSEMREADRLNRRLEIIEANRFSQADDAQDQRLRALERAVFSQDHEGG